MAWTVSEIIIVAVIAFIGGTFGGLLGLGGSIFIIPALTLTFGAHPHLYQAAALISNIFAATAATLRHRGRGTIRVDIVPTMATAAGVAAIAGVLLSNQLPARPLMILFGLFLCYCSLAELVSVVRRQPDAKLDPDAKCPKLLSGAIGGAGGFASGLLGVGGGAIMVPLLKKIAKLPLRQAVASSAAAIIAACIIGAITKNASLSSLQGSGHLAPTLRSSLVLAAVLSPFAMAGGHVGATLVYHLPINITRLVLASLLALGGVRMVLTVPPSPAAVEQSRQPKVTSTEDPQTRENPNGK